jgi:hypothetical protein
MKILKSIGLMSLIFTTVLIGFGSSIAQAATYTVTDVAAHNTSTDCWVIVNNNVYDLTDFITSHSDKAPVIETQCGRNGTALFNGGPYSVSTLNDISSYLLGPLTVVSPILTSLTVIPTAPTVIIGGTIHLNATPKNQNGGAFIGATTTFSSNNTAIATVGNTSGIVTGVAIGTATITATSTSGNITVTKTSVVTVTDVTPTLVLDSVKITPASPSVQIGKTIQLTAKDKNQNGGNFTGATTTFHSSDTSIATVDSSTGKVTGVVIGTATITATSTYGNVEVSGTVIVKVVDTTVVNTNNNGKHFGQFKNWFRNWFKNHHFGKRIGFGFGEKNNHQNNNNDNEGNDN